MQKCRGLLELGNSVLESCGSFFDPAMLAQLDAALAHEFAAQARARADDAAGELDSAIRGGRSAETLAALSERLSAAKSAASKAEARFAQATDVIAPLGGNPTSAGFDAVAVGQISAATLIDVIDKLETAKNAMAAAQAHAQTLFVASQRLSQAQVGVPKERIGKGIAHQVALARHESPHRGRQLCELAEVLVRELPCSMDAFSRGSLNEFRARIVATETVFLSFEDRARVDRCISGDVGAVELMGTRELRAAARKAAYQLDPEAFVKRGQKAVGDRYVSLRPAADGMTFLTALIPLKQGVRILNTLTKVAQSARAAGDERSKGQVMADALMHRLIQHAACDDGAGTISDHRGAPAPGADGAGGGWPGAVREPWCTAVREPEIALELVMTDRSLFGSDNEPAVLVGYEPIPAPTARDMILQPDTAADGFSPRVWLKRLFTHPDSNALLAMDSRARVFPEGMKEFIRLRDQRCQTLYCDAPIREFDHIKSYAAGGPTTTENGQGLCTDCNQAKEAPGWQFQRGTGPAGEGWATETTTPTGRRYVSVAPPLPGSPGRNPGRSKKRRC
ncbi:HNH endonuclease [Arthrobacter sp. HY1533]|uniref:HNH endonuclease n=1 Tax=Arthrobacter sp. HY1533 TaxID=2970919 RepID=UPI0022BA0CD7|nr:HNH endonuclease [Arthrobacter sp. HY1533]